MNKIYKIVWSHVKNCYVVTSELAKAKVKVGRSIVLSGIILSMSLSVNATSTAVSDSGSAVATGTDAVAVGEKAKATGKDTVAVGADAVASKDYDISMGYKAVATEKYAIAIGNEAQAKGERVISLGWKSGDTNMVGGGSIFIGTSAGFKSKTQIMGHDIWGTIAIGQNAAMHMQGDANIAIGSTAGSYHSGSQNIFIGDDSKAAKVSRMATTLNAYGYGNRNLVIGSNYVDPKVKATDNTTDYVNDVIALGTFARAQANKSIAIGSSSENKVWGASSEGERSIAIGVSSSPTMVGARSKGDDSIAFGAGTFAEALGSIAIGRDAISTHVNSIALGSQTTDKAFSALDTGLITTTNNGSYAYSGFVGEEFGIGVVSVGKDGASTRQIVNVAPGIVSATSTDAINGSQLYAVANRVESGWQVAGNNKARVANISPEEKVSFLNGNHTTAAVATDGTGATVTYNAVTQALKVENGKVAFNGNATDGTTPGTAEDGTALVTAGDVMSAINSASWNVGSDSAANKEVKAVKAGDTVKLEAGSNIDLTQAGTTFTYALNPDIKVNSVAIVNGPVINNEGMKFVNADGSKKTDAPSITNTGIDGGSQKITNVANGIVAGDAVNYGQLLGVESNVTKLQAGFKLKSGAKETQVTLGADAVPTIEFAADKNLAVALDGKKITYGLNNVITIGSASTDKPIKLDGTTGQITGLTNTTLIASDFGTAGRAATEEQVKAVNDKVDAANSAVTTKGFTFNGDTGTTGVKKLGDSVAVTGDKNISTKATAAGVEITLNKNITVDSVTIASGPVINADGMHFTNADGSLDKTAPSINNVNGINAGGKAISGVGTGIKTDDAVNVAQLKSEVAMATSAAKTEVKAGKNVISVDKTVDKKDGHEIYTVNAKDTVLESGSISYDDKGHGTLTLVNNDRTTATITGAKNIYTVGAELKGNALTFERNDGTSYVVEGVASTKDVQRIDVGMSKLNDNINQVGAGSAALAGLNPLGYDPDNKMNVAVSAGLYKNAQALAIGAFYHPNENTLISLGTTLGNADNMVNIGASFKVGSTDHERKLGKIYPDTPISTVYVLEKELVETKEEMSKMKHDYETRIKALEELVGKMAKK